MVDDSSTMRSLLRAAISSDPELELVGEAATGSRITEVVHRNQPDVVLLDVEMPGEGGLEALTAIHRSWPSLPVIMFSTTTSSGSPAAVEALARGATDFATKPRAANAAEARESIAVEVLPRLKRAHRRATPLAAPVEATALPQRGTPTKVDAVVVGASTGGPQALTTFLSGIPATFRLPIMVVQHMPASFTGLFAERLGRHVPLSVHEARHGQAIEPGNVYIAPGDKHLAVDKPDRLHLLDTPPENSCKPAADVLFRTAAKTFNGRVLAVLLTGMGSDGTDGARHIVSGGGALLCQDQESSVVWGMPGSAARAGLAYKVLPLEQLAAEVLRVSGGTK